MKVLRSSHSSWESHRLVRVRRRLVTLPGLVALLVLTYGLALPALMFGSFVDLFLRRPASTSRVILYGLWWLSVETVGVVVAGFLWLRYVPAGALTEAQSRRCHSRVQGWWVRQLIHGGRVLLGLRYSMEGSDLSEASGPLIVLARHGSQGDALLVASALSDAGYRPRFVVKRQLLWDPCLDLYGHRIPNYFVDRDSNDNKVEIDNIGRLAEDMDPDEALVIFPEGTRFSQTKLERSIQVLAKMAPQRLEAVNGLRRVLPIRVPGVLSLLQHNDDADLVLLNHVGVGDFSSLLDLWRNIPFSKQLKFMVERLDRQEVPGVDHPEELVRYLDSLWVGFDEWVLHRESVK